jgi:hypothetical protein
METSIPNKHARWISDLLVVVVCVVGCVFLFGWALDSICRLEHRVYARVLEEDENHDGNVLVDFIYKDRKYQKSIDGRGDLKSGETVPLHFFRNPMRADWYSHHRRWRGPSATPIGSFLCIVAFFTIFIPPALLWKRLFRGRRPLPLITISHIITRYLPMVSRVRAWLKHFHARLKQKTYPVMMGIIYAFIAVLIICVIGLTPHIIFGTPASERDDSYLLAESYLSAMVDGRINDACELIYREKRYDFLSNCRRWKLRDYRIIGQPEKVSTDYEYHSGLMHVTMGEEPHIWNVKFWHHSILDGKAIEKTSVLGTIYIDQFWINTGYLPNN